MKVNTKHREQKQKFTEKKEKLKIETISRISQKRTCTKIK